MKMVKVVNLLTGDEYYYNLSPVEAVRMAYLQYGCKNFNTWEYNQKPVIIKNGKYTVSCGDYVALK